MAKLSDVQIEEKCKDIDWGKVAKTLQELVVNKK